MPNSHSPAPGVSKYGMKVESRRSNFGLGAMHRSGDDGPVENAIDKTGGDLKKDWVYEGKPLVSNYDRNRYPDMYDEDGNDLHPTEDHDRFDHDRFDHDR